MIGSIVNNSIYFHKSAIQYMAKDVQEMVEVSLIEFENWIQVEPVFNYGYDLISVDMKNCSVSFIGVPTFDDSYTPKIDHRVTVEWDDGKPLNVPNITFIKYTDNFPIIHSRYEMVSSDYRHFNIKLDREYNIRH